MKRVEPEAVGDVLRQTLQQQGMTGRLYEARAVSLWPSVVGEHIASMCGRPVMNNGLMTLYVRSAPLRQELSMSRTQLMHLINETLGREVVREIRFK